MLAKELRPLAVNVVLVGTLYEMNVGATSRAMANMGFSRLIMIDRKCELTYAAQQAAATGQAAWQNRIEYKSWEEFFKHEPEGLRLGFSARDGRERPVQDWSAALRDLKTHADWQLSTSPEPLPLYLIFGPEDRGLSNEDLRLAHRNCNIPTFGDNSSLNLAQAVLLALFVFRQELGGTRTTLDGQQPNRLDQNPRPQIFPENTLRTWLDEMGFDLSKPLNAASVLQRMMLHNVPTTKEMEMLETVLQQSIRKLREYNELRKSKSEKA